MLIVLAVTAVNFEYDSRIAGRTHYQRPWLPRGPHAAATARHRFALARVMAGLSIAEIGPLTSAKTRYAINRFIIVDFLSVGIL